MQQIIVTMPVIALRGLTVLPGMTVSFDISRAKSVAAVEKAMVSDQKVGPFCTEESGRYRSFSGTALSYWNHCAGQAAGKNARRNYQSHGRRTGKGELLELDSEEPSLVGEILEAPVLEGEEDYVTSEAMIRVLKDKAEEYGKQHPKFEKEVLPNLLRCERLSPLMMQMASEMPWDYRIRQQYLEASSEEEQYEVIVASLVNEVEISRIRREFQEKVKRALIRIRGNTSAGADEGYREELGEDSLSDADE